jgi:hypothetical protein
LWARINDRQYDKNSRLAAWASTLSLSGLVRLLSTLVVKPTRRVPELPEMV